MTGLTPVLLAAVQDLAVVAAVVAGVAALEIVVAAMRRNRYP